MVLIGTEAGWHVLWQPMCLEHVSSKQSEPVVQHSHWDKAAHIASRLCADCRVSRAAGGTILFQA